MVRGLSANTSDTGIPGDVRTARGPFGGTYELAEFFTSMGTNWDKAVRCLKPMLPTWIRQTMHGAVLSKSQIDLVKRYDDPGAVNAIGQHIVEPLTAALCSVLGEKGNVVVSAEHWQGVTKRPIPIITFGVFLRIQLLDERGFPLENRYFEGFLNFQQRGKWGIINVPDVNDRTVNDPTWLIPSKTARVNGLDELPMPMRLDMYGQLCTEEGWSGYSVYGQQLLLIADIRIVRADSRNPQ